MTTTRLDLLERVPQRWPAVLALCGLTTAVLFSDFLFGGKLLVASSDHIFNHYPNLIHGHRAFWRGEWGLWNPLIFTGVDFSTSFHHHLLHPINWIVLPFPEGWILHVMSARAFVEFIAIGMLAWGIVRRFVPEGPSATFLAVVAQLGGFTWFSATTLIGLHLMAASLASILILLTSHSRRFVINGLLLTVCFFDILMMGHIGYIVAYGFPIVVVFCWRQGWNIVRRPWVGDTPAVMLAFVAGLAMAAVRIVPVLRGLLFEQRFLDSVGLPSIASHGYLTLTVLVPEAFGIHLQEAQNVGNSLLLRGRHTQFHNLLYFGVGPLLLVWMALTGGLSKRAWGLAIVTACVALTPMYLFQPLSDLGNILLYPLTAEILPRTWGWFLLMATLIVAVRDLEAADQAFQSDRRRLQSFVALLGLAVAGTVALWVKMIQENQGFVGDRWPLVMPAARIVLLVILGLTFWLATRGRLRVGQVTRWTNWGMGLVAVLLALVLYAARKSHLLGQSWITLRCAAFAMATMLWAVAVLFYARQATSRRSPLWLARLSLALGGLAVVVFLFPLSEVGGARTLSATLVAALLSLLKLIAVGAVVLEIAVRCRGPFRQALFPLLLLLTVGELIGFNRIYSHVGTSPFLKLAHLYPEHHEPTRDDWQAARDANNELKNPQLVASAGAPRGWKLGGDDLSSAAPLANIVRLKHDNTDLAALYQDLPLAAPTGQISFGCWVRCDEANRARLLLAGGNRGPLSDFHSGSGEWEWLGVTVPADGLARVRAHITLSGPGEAEVFGPRLVRARMALPGNLPVDPIHPTPAYLASLSPPELDLAMYRVTNPTQFVNWQPSEVLGNVAMVYGVPTYGGVDSDVKRSLADLIAAFEKPGSPIVHRMGIMGEARDPRLLDLLGVKYDRRGNALVVRPHALARLSLFSRCEWATDRSQLLRRLADSAFDHTTTLALEGRPVVPPEHGTQPVPAVDSDAARQAVRPEENDPARFQPVPYQSTTDDVLHASVDCPAPRLLLFNDSYSPAWTCRVDGRPMIIQPANGNFMAVSLPAGRHDVTFEFRPSGVRTLAGVSMAVACGVLGLAACVAFPRRRPPQAKIRIPPQLERRAAA